MVFYVSEKKAHATTTRVLSAIEYDNVEEKKKKKSVHQKGGGVGDIYHLKL